VIPVGYMAKRVSLRPEWLKAPNVVDLYSVSPCVSADFAPYIEHWQRSPEGRRLRRRGEGVFITTSTFTPQAVDFAKSVERIVLVDGVRLAELMIEHEVGVTSRPVKVPKLDSDYFEE
jgi:hypothetical protein